LWLREPTLTTYVGPMMASKTTHLLLDIERAKMQHATIAVIKPAVDTRYASTAIVTHGGLSVPAITVMNALELEAACKGATFIALDEAFMIPGAAAVIKSAFARGCSISVSTLDLSADVEAFEESSKLMAIATHVVKLRAVCVDCGRCASFTRLKHTAVASAQQIRIGGAETYEPVCFEHHPSLGGRRADV